MTIVKSHLVALVKAFSPVSTMLSLHDVCIHDSSQVRRLRGGNCIDTNVVASYMLCGTMEDQGKIVEVA